jgi:hypothetical protein
MKKTKKRLNEREQISQELDKLNKSVEQEIKKVDRLILDLKKMGLRDENRV